MKCTNYGRITLEEEEEEEERVSQRSDWRGICYRTSSERGYVVPISQIVRGNKSASSWFGWMVMK